MGLITNSSKNPLVPKLFGYWISTCSFRIRIILNLKQISYELETVNLIESEHLSSKFSFPVKLIPTLSIDGHLFSESMSIALYLEDTRPDPILLPKNSVDKAHVLQICEHFNANIQPLQNLRVRKYLVRF